MRLCGLKQQEPRLAGYPRGLQTPERRREHGRGVTVQEPAGLSHSCQRADDKIIAGGTRGCQADTSARSTRHLPYAFAASTLRDVTPAQTEPEADEQILLLKVGVRRKC